MRHDIYFSALPWSRSRHHMSFLKPSRGGEACGMTYNRACACVAGSVAVHTGQECSLSDIHACRPSHMGLALMRCRYSRPCAHTLAGHAHLQHAYSSQASPRGTDAPGLAQVALEVQSEEMPYFEISAAGKPPIFIRIARRQVRMRCFSMGRL